MQIMATLQPITPQLRPYFKTKFDKINWLDMSSNPSPGAIKLLEQNFEKICWYSLSSNPSPGAIKLLEANPDKIDWRTLGFNSNPDAIKLIETNLGHNEIAWSKLSSNPHAIKLLEANQDKIDWDELSANPKGFKLLVANIDKINDSRYYAEGGAGVSTTLTWDDFTEDVLQIVNINWELISCLQSCPSPAWRVKLEQNVDKLDWGILSRNANDHIMHILEQNTDKIHWYELSSNTNPRAIRILEQNPDKIDWFYLARNPSAMDLISKNLDEIYKKGYWYRLSSNPNPAAIPLLEHHVDEINWRFLSENPHAVNILKQNSNKIYWDKAPVEVFDSIPCPKINWDYRRIDNIKRRRRHLRKNNPTWSTHRVNAVALHLMCYELDDKWGVWSNPNIFVFDADSQNTTCIVCYDSTTTQTACCLQPLCKECNKICKNSCKSCPMCRALSKTALRLQQLNEKRLDIVAQLTMLIAEEHAIRRSIALED
jgi:hypothetical protein